MTYYGETPTVDGDYTVVKFLETGEFVTPEGVTEGKVLVVAGGGGGGFGGGGGGGYLTDTDVALFGTMAVVVGTGGDGHADVSGNPGHDGLDSSFADLVAAGGGGGGCVNGNGAGGGSGGGGGGTDGVDTTGGSGSQGAAGGSCATYHSAPWPSAGGGGAAAVGQGPPGGSGAGAGGAGYTNDIVATGHTGAGHEYAGGGGGGTWGAGIEGQATHGGGAGTRSSSGSNGQAGTANTGGGGGGGSNARASGAGGSGIVVIRYLTWAADDTATLTITSRHKVRELLFVRKTVTSRHLVGYVYTPPPARLALRSRHIVNGVQGAARLALTSRHAVAELVRLTLTSRHLVRDVDPATLSLNSLHVVGFSARLALTSRHRVPRRTVILPGSDPPIEVVDDVTLYASFNGIDLNNGSTTHVLADGTDVGGNAPEYDTIRHYDGSLLIHDVRGAFSTITIPEIVTFSTAAGLSAWIAGLNAACRDGGSFTLQESDGATARTFLIAPGPEPSIPENNRFFIQHVAIFDLVLTRWPE